VIPVGALALVAAGIAVALLSVRPKVRA
jgi:hypothetical protein